jgi:hypothetical protein
MVPVELLRECPRKRLMSVPGRYNVMHQSTGYLVPR